MVIPSHISPAPSQWSPPRSCCWKSKPTAPHAALPPIYYCICFMSLYCLWSVSLIRMYWLMVVLGQGFSLKMAMYLYDSRIEVPCPQKLVHSPFCLSQKQLVSCAYFQCFFIQIQVYETIILIPPSFLTKVSLLYVLFCILHFSLNIFWRPFLRGMLRLHLGISRMSVLLD